MMIDEEKPKGRIGKRGFFAILGAVIFAASLGSYLLVRGPSPLSELQKYSDIELPVGSKGVIWRTEDRVHHGIFELPKPAIPAFQQRYGMQVDKILSYESTADLDRCVERGLRESLRLNEETGALEVALDPHACAKK